MQAMCCHVKSKTTPHKYSGIAKLGHNGALALATRGMPELSVLKVPMSIVNRALKIHEGLEIKLHSISSG